MLSDKKGSVLLIIIGLLVVVIGVALFLILPSMKQSTIAMNLGTGTFEAQVMTDYSEISKGISSATEFGSKQAVLMVYPDSGKWGVVVRDMGVSIDLVWLNDNKQVVYYVKSIEPSEAVKTFIPKLSAKYVVELAAGTVDKDAIKITSVATFDIKSTAGK